MAEEVKKDAKKGFKVNLETGITKVDGKPLENDVENPKTKKMEKKQMKVRDYILIFLGQRFAAKTNREMFWATELGIACADEKNKELEVEDKKRDFLVRLVKDNKLKIQGPMGQDVEKDLLFPYEKSQLLSALMTPEELEEWLEEDELMEKIKDKEGKK